MVCCAGGAHLTTSQLYYCCLPGGRMGEVRSTSLAQLVCLHHANLATVWLCPHLLMSTSNIPGQRSSEHCCLTTSPGLRFHSWHLQVGVGETTLWTPVDQRKLSVLLWRSCWATTPIIHGCWLHWLSWWESKNTRRATNPLPWLICV